MRTWKIDNHESFCNIFLTLRLQFDFNEAITFDYSSFEGFSEDETIIMRKPTLNCLHLFFRHFNEIVSLRKETKYIYDVLKYKMCNNDGIKELDKIKSVKQLTGASVIIYANAHGEYVDSAETYKIFGLEKTNGSLREQTTEIKNTNFDQFTDDALETIVLYEDADGEQIFLSEGKKKGIDYETASISKTIVCWMNSDGKIETEICYRSSICTLENPEKYDNMIDPKETGPFGLDLYLSNISKRLELLKDSAYCGEIIEKVKNEAREMGKSQGWREISEWELSQIKPESIAITEDIQFEDKIFSFSNLGRDYLEEMKSEIGLRGGTLLPLYKSIDEADYCIINLYASYPITTCLDWLQAINRDTASPIKLILVEQLWMALQDPQKPPIMTQKELKEKARKEREEKKISAKKDIGPGNQTSNEERERRARDIKDWQEGKYYSGRGDIVRPLHPFYDRDKIEILKNIDNDAPIDFVGKIYVLTGFDISEEDKVKDEIEKRGAHVHDRMIKNADYLVINRTVSVSAKLREAIKWKEKGFPKIIITDSQLYEAFKKTPPLPYEETLKLWQES